MILNQLFDLVTDSVCISHTSWIAGRSENAAKNLTKYVAGVECRRVSKEEIYKRKRPLISRGKFFAQLAEEK